MGGSGGAVLERAMRTGHKDRSRLQARRGVTNRDLADRTKNEKEKPGVGTGI